MTHFQSLDLAVQTKLIDVQVTAAYDSNPDRSIVVARIRPGIRVHDDADSLIIQSNRQPQPAFSVGVYAHRVVEAAYVSAKSNSIIRLQNK